MLTTKQANIIGQTILILSDCPEIPTNSSDPAAKLFCGETQPEPGLKSVLYLSWTSFIFRAWKRRDLGGIWVRALLCCALFSCALLCAGSGLQKSNLLLFFLLPGISGGGGVGGPLYIQQAFRRRCISSTCNLLR